MTAIADLAEDLFRREAARLTAALARRTGAAGIGMAEDAVQEALAQALRVWPFRGVPDDPAAWLAAVAANKLRDAQRRAAGGLRAAPALAHHIETEAHAPEAAAGRGEISDDMLRLAFACCDPQIPPDDGAVLVLRLVGGFGAREIARAFFVAEPAMAQRLVRAKARLRTLAPDLAVPAGKELPPRLQALLRALYLAFAAGHTAAEGDALLHEDVCAETFRLVELVCSRPDLASGEAHALAALIAFTTARLPARLDATGALATLERQDRTRWDRAVIAAGFAHLQAAQGAPELTRFHIEAGIAATHAAAPSFAATDWGRIAGYYAMLEEISPSPVVGLNAAVARAFAEGAGVGLAALERLRGTAVARDRLWHAARGDLLVKLGRRTEAAEAFAEALACPMTAPERAHLARRMAECAS